MPSDQEIEAAARALATLGTAPGREVKIELWLVPAIRALEAAELVRDRDKQLHNERRESDGDE